MRYCLGFVFNQTRDSVLLIRKERPDWQRGKLNGVGGKLEYQEDPCLGMVREFKEETDVDTVLSMWNKFAELIFDNDGGELHAYWLVDQYTFDNAKTVTDEPLQRITVDQLQHTDHVIPNLKWLVPAALSAMRDRGESLLVAYYS